ncbi:ATP-binding cassette domain-containing protein [Verrucomicrobia bacterium S94]|nr:ATP-binding cassette domain-containing protein [Verrucomicrobia bacterium S94]
MTDPIITCSDVCIAYGRQEVLHSVNLQIPRGIFLPFTGPNGSGKTTLLRAVLGLVPIRQGQIITPFRQTPAGYVPQHRVIDPLYPVSVRQIVEMGLSTERRLFRPLTGRQKRAVVTALEELGMAEHMQKTFRELSGGMKQKVLIARALVRQPDVIIMDEPTSELDEQSEHDVLKHLMKLNQNAGKTVLMVHHDLELAGTLSDTICRVGRGKAEMVKLNGGRTDA